MSFAKGAIIFAACTYIREVRPTHTGRDSARRRDFSFFTENKLVYNGKLW